MSCTTLNVFPTPRLAGGKSPPAAERHRPQRGPRAALASPQSRWAQQSILLSRNASCKGFQRAVLDLGRTLFLALITPPHPGCLYTRLSCGFPLFHLRVACVFYYGRMSVVACSYTESAQLIRVVASGCLLGNLVADGQQRTCTRAAQPRELQAPNQD